MKAVLFCTIFALILIVANGCPASKNKDKDNDIHKHDQDKQHDDEGMINNGSETSSNVQSDKTKQGKSNVSKKERSKLYNMDVELDLMGYSLDMDKSEENRDDKGSRKKENKWIHVLFYWVFILYFLMKWCETFFKAQNIV